MIQTISLTKDVDEISFWEMTWEQLLGDQDKEKVYFETEPIFCVVFFRQLTKDFVPRSHDDGDDDDAIDLQLSYNCKAVKRRRNEPRRRHRRDKNALIRL